MKNLTGKLLSQIKGIFEIGLIKGITNRVKGNFKKNPKISVAILLCVIGLLAYFLFFAETSTTKYEYIKVNRDTFKTTIEGSGKVASNNEVDLKLQSGGQVTSILVTPGQKVSKGQILARLDSRSQAIDLSKAQASYNKIINGATALERDNAKNDVTSSQASLELVKKEEETKVANAKKTLLNTTLIARPVYDDKITPKAPIVTGNYTCDKEIEYKIIINTPGYAQVSPSSKGTVDITSVPQKIDDCGLYISFDSSVSYYQGEWKIQIPDKLSSNYISNLNAYNQALENQAKNILNAQSNVTASQYNLQTKTDSARAEDIQTAKASLDAAYLNYENTIVRAPFAGEVGKVDIKLGEYASNGASAATIVTKGKVAEISLNEVDIADVKLGQKVDLTFDAIQDLELEGTVTEIDTVGTTESNVVTFKVKIAFDNDDNRVKPGMSMTANIITYEKEDTLLLQSSAIKEDRVGKYVIIKNGEDELTEPTTKAYVEVGITDDINAEILSGLEERQEVYYRAIEEKQKVVSGLFSPPSRQTTRTGATGGNANLRMQGGATGGATTGGNRTFQRAN